MTAKGYIPLFDDALLAGEPEEDAPVTPEERDSVLREIGRYTGGTISRIADTLALPGDLVRGWAIGKPGERVTGRDLLRHHGLIGEEDNWGNFAGGLAADMLTDPTAFLTGPAKALTPAGKALKAAGMLGDASTAATRKLISSGALQNADEVLPNVVKLNKKGLDATGRTISTFDPATIGRPLVGKRVAMRDLSLDDIIQYADNPLDAENALRGVLGDAGLAKLRGQKGLSKSFGIGLPLSEPAIVGDFLGKRFGDTYADALDTLGTAVRWSPVGRGLAAAFDNRVGGKLDAEEQITNIAMNKAKQRLGADATAEHTLRLSRLNQAHPDVFQGEEGNRVLGRYIEDVATPEDLAYIDARPGLKEYADWFAGQGGARQQYFNALRKQGIPGADLLDDEYGNKFLPRRAEQILGMESHWGGDETSRTHAMQVPGGRDTIIELSRDPYLVGKNRIAGNDEEAALYIQNLLSPLPPPPPGLSNQGAAVVQGTQPAISLDKAKRIARVLNQLPEDIVQKSPLFGQHPTEMIGDYMRSSSEKMGMADTLYNSMATLAKNEPYDMVGEGGHIPIPEALKRLKLQDYSAGTVGASAQMRDRLAKLWGLDPANIDLSKVSIPEAHVTRLMRGKDAFQNGELAKSLVDWFDWYTQAWKGAILTWPARATRDLYSGALSNWLEGAFDMQSANAARALIQEGPNSTAFKNALSAIPRYKGDDGINRFYAELAGTGLIGKTQFHSPGAAVIAKGALSGLPGSTPVTASSIVGELLPQSGRSWKQYGKDFMTWQSSLTPLQETKNPILRAGEKMNSLTDGINRLTGYLSLLKKGYDPKAAAEAMKRAHVDYSSLTGFEKTWLRGIFPWYSYQSRIFREVLRQLVEQPGGRAGQMIEALDKAQNEGNEDTYVPSALRSQFAFPIPEEYGGKPAPGVQKYLTSFETPLNVLNMAGSPGEMARLMGMQTNPVLRTTLEAMTGKDFFHNAPLGDPTTAADAIVRKMTGDPNADVPWAIDKLLLENLPFAGRPLNLARALVNDKGGIPLDARLRSALINSLTGIKERPVAMEDIIADAIREIEEANDPYTKEHRSVFIPKNRKATTPHKVVREMAVANALRRERAALREPKQVTDALSLFQ